MAELGRQYKKPAQNQQLDDPHLKSMSLVADSKFVPLDPNKNSIIGKKPQLLGNMNKEVQQSPRFNNPYNNYGVGGYEDDDNIDREDPIPEDTMIKSGIVGGTLDFQANDRDEETIRQQTQPLGQKVEKSNDTVPYLERSNIRDRPKQDNKVMSPTDFEVSLPEYKGI